MTTTGLRAYGNNVALAGPATLTGTVASFFGGLDGNGNALVLNFTSSTAIAANGSFTDLASLTSTGPTALAGTVITTGQQSYQGATSLTGAIELQRSAGSFTGGLDAAGNALTLNFTQSTAVTGSVFSNLSDLTSLGPVALSGQIDSSGFQNYATAATLSADTTLNATGNIDFGSLVDGARQLNIQSGGNVSFFAALGSTTPLQGLNLASAAAVTALGALAIDGTGGTGAGLRIGDGVSNVNIAQPGGTISNAALSGILLAGNTTGSTMSGFTITNSGSHGIEAAGGSYTGTTIENSSITARVGDGFHAANATGLTATLLHSADNAKAGIRVAGTSSNVTISDSLIGLDANGTAAQPNLGQGIVVSVATGTTLQGNTISNHTVGVLVDNGANLTIGSANGTLVSDPDANVITKNTSAGVVVNGAGSQNVSILSNSIFENDFIGISLSAGGNALARTPTLTSATTTAVVGSITGTDGDVYRIQYFKSADAVTSSSRFAQGQELIGYQDVTIAGGTASIDEDISGSSVIVTDWITATATLLVGGLPSETSQFSFGIRVTA